METIEPAFYAGAQEMVTRWSQSEPGASGPNILSPMPPLIWTNSCREPETQVFRLESSCAEEISIELWMGEGSGHSPNYGEAFVDALVGWFLAQG